MADLTGKPGFAPTHAARTRTKRRAAALELMATVALTVSLAVAAAAVSTGGNRSLTHGEAHLQRPAIR